jgi:tape measure domain-containing protein
MADGYDLEIDVDLDDDPYRRKIRELVAATKKAGAEMERALTITPRLDTKVYQGQLARLNGQKLKDKKVNLDADTAKAQADIKAFQAREEANAINKRVNVDTGYATSQLLTFSRGIEQTANRLGSMAMLAGAAGAAIGALGVGIAGFGLATAARLDQAQFGFERLMGGAQAAAPILKDLKAAALNTPFDLNDVLTLAFRLKSAGRASNGLAKDATVLADALAATGGGAMQLEGALFQIQQLQGRSKILEREDLRTLNNQIPGFMAAYQKLFGDKREFNEPQKAMEAVFESLKAIPGAAGAAAAATEETFSGRFSKFKDVIQISFAEAFIPEKETLFKGLDTITEAISGFLEGFAPVGAQALAALADAFAKLIVAGGPIVTLFTAALPQVLNNFVPLVEKGAAAFEKLGITSDQVAKAITALLVGGAFLKLGGMILGVVTPILTFATAAGPFIAGIGKIGSVFGAVATAGSAVGGTIMGMVGAFSIAGGGVSGLAAAATGLLAVLGPIGITIAVVASGIAALGVALSSSKPLREDFINSFKTLGKGVAFFLGSFKDLAVGIFNILKPVGEALGPIVSGLVTGLGVVLGVVGGLVRIFGALVKAVAPVVGFILKLVLVFSPLGMAIAFVRFVAEKFGKQISAIGEFLGKVVGKIGEWAGAVARFFTGLVEKAEEFLSKVPIIGKFFDEDEKNKDKNISKTEEWAEAQKKAVDKTKERYDSLKTALNDLFKVDTARIDTSSLASLSGGLGAELTAARTKLDNTRSLIDKGFGSLVSFATEIGGEAGKNLITEFASKIEGDPAALEAFKKQLVELKLLEIQAESEARTAAQRILQEEANKNRAMRETMFGKPGGGFIQGQGGFLPPEVANRATIVAPVPEETKTAIVSSAKEVETIVSKAFATLDFGAAIQPAFKNFASSIADQIKIDDTVGKRVRGIVGGIALTFVGAVASMRPFAPLSESLSAELTKATGALNGFLFTLMVMTPRFYSAGQSLGQQLAKGLSDGIAASGVNGSIGSGVYSSIAKSWNSAAAQIEAAYRTAKAAFQGLGKTSGFQMTGPMANLGSLSLPRLASGTHSFKGGLAILGENGPEIAGLPKGTHVTPAHKSKEMLKPTQTSSDTYNINVQGVSFEDAMSRMEAKMRAKRRQVMA